jgi:adenylate kinase
MGFVEDELKQLKEVIGNLDSRIKQLEKRATGSSPSSEEIRMIIMGPPGAGKQLDLLMSIACDSE